MGRGAFRREPTLFVRKLLSETYSELRFSSSDFDRPYTEFLNKH